MRYPSNAIHSRTFEQNCKIIAFCNSILSAKTETEKKAIRKAKREFEDQLEADYEEAKFEMEMSGVDVFA